MRPYKICEYKDGLGNSVYRVQRKGWLWGWNFIKESHCGYGDCYYTIKEWYSLEAAQIFVAEQTTKEQMEQRTLVGCK